MSKGFEALKRLKWGLDITQEERINLCECIEKELKVLYALKRISYYDIHFFDYLLSNGQISQVEHDLLKEVLL